MTSPADRERLLGLNAYAPPEGLRSHSRFKSAEAYLDFLARTRRDPDPFFASLGKELPWMSPPRGVGSSGDWFPGGKLNACDTCLDAFLKEGQDDPCLLDLDPVRGTETSLSRRELLSRVAVLAGRIRKFGLQPGQRVLLAMPPDSDLVVALFACLRLGLVCVPCDPSMDNARLSRRAEAAFCKVVITSPAFGPAAAGVGAKIPNRMILEAGWEKERVDPVAALAVDSMHPALVVADNSGQLFSLPTAGFLMQARSSYRILLDGRGKGDRHWLLLPSHHASLLSGLLGALADGGQVALVPAESMQGPGDFFAAFAKLRPRVVVARIKTVLRLMGDKTEGPLPVIPGPDLFVVEGETVEPGTFHALRAGIFGGNTHVVQVLSRPESGGFIAGPCAAVTPVRPASVAYPAPGLDLAVVDEAGQECPVNRGGFVAMRRTTPALAIELQRAKLPVPLGVQARMDREGQLWTMGEVHVDRPDEDGLALPEQEALIAGIEGVEQVAVVRYQDPEGLMRTRAFVKISGGGQTLEVIQKKIRDRFGEHAVPDSFQVVGSLPISRTGKLLRTVLRRIASGEVDGLSDVGAVADPEVVRGLILGAAKKP